MPIKSLTSAALVRDHIAAILTEVLGTWKDGTPAIWIGPPPARLAPATGCQCIIQPVPSGPAYNVSREARFLDQSWDCRLINIQPRDSQSSLGMAANWLSRSPHVRSMVHVPATPTTAEQLTFRIYAPGFVGGLNTIPGDPTPPIPPLPPIPANVVTHNG